MQGDRVDSYLEEASRAALISTVERKLIQQHVQRLLTPTNPSQSG